MMSLNLVRLGAALFWSISADAAMAQTTPPPLSPFIEACMSSGGTAGSAYLKTSRQRVQLYTGQTALLLSLTLSAEKEITSVDLLVDALPAVTICPGEGRIIMAKTLEITGNMSGTVNKGFDYCLQKL